MLRKDLDRLLFPVRNDRGVALIIALIMLAVMSLIGALAMTTTESELAITTNVRAANEAFRAADRAAEFAMSSGAMISAVGSGSVDLDTYTVDGDLFSLVVKADKGRLKTNAEDPTINNRISYIATGGLPLGVESDPTYFEGRYYDVAVAGAVEGHPAVSRVESQFVRIFPKAGM